MHVGKIFCDGSRPALEMLGKSGNFCRKVMYLLLCRLRPLAQVEVTSALGPSLSLSKVQQL